MGSLRGPRRASVHRASWDSAARAGGAPAAEGLAAERPPRRRPLVTPPQAVGRDTRSWPGIQTRRASRHHHGAKRPRLTVAGPGAVSMSAPDWCMCCARRTGRTRRQKSRQGRTSSTNRVRPAHIACCQICDRIGFRSPRIRPSRRSRRSIARDRETWRNSSGSVGADSVQEDSRSHLFARRRRFGFWSSTRCSLRSHGILRGHLSTMVIWRSIYFSCSTDM